MASNHPDLFERQVRHRAKMRQRSLPPDHSAHLHRPIWLKQTGKNWVAIFGRLLDDDIATMKAKREAVLQDKDALLQLMCSQEWKQLQESATKVFASHTAALRQQTWKNIQKLPTELRLQIYSHAYSTLHVVKNTKDFFPYKHYFNFQKGQSMIRYANKSSSAYQQSPDLCFLDTNLLTYDLPDEVLMDQSLYIEFVRNWYKHTTFKVDAAYVKEFLYQKSWPYPFIPADVVSKVFVVLRYGETPQDSLSMLRNRARDIAEVAAAIYPHSQAGLEMRKAFDPECPMLYARIMRLTQGCLDYSVHDIVARRLVIRSMQEVWPDVLHHIHLATSLRVGKFHTQKSGPISSEEFLGRDLVWI